MPQRVVALISHSWQPTTGAGKCAVELKHALSDVPSWHLVLEERAVRDGPTKGMQRLLDKAIRFRAIVSLVRRESVDVVIVNTTVQSSVVIAARMAGARVIWWCHESGDSLVRPLMKLRVRLYRLLCHRTVVVTRAAPPHAPNPVLIRNRVDVESNSAPRRTGPTVLLVLGRKGHRKGTDLLPRLLDPQSFPDAQLWIIGDEEPRESATLRATHHDLVAGWGPRLRWVDAQDDVGPVLDQASVLLLPSRAEARPRVVEEALAHGVPAITSPIPGVVDIGGTVTHSGALTVVSLDEPWNEVIHDALRLDLPKTPLIAPFSETEFVDAWLRVLDEC